MEHSELRREYAREYRANNKEKVKKSFVEYYNINKERLLLNKKIYNDQNIEKNKLRQKKYHEQNKERRNKYSRLWYINNKESRMEYNKKYYLENKNREHNRHKTWWKSNKDKVRVKNHKYRASKKKLISTLTTEDWNESLAYFDYSCAYCGGKENLQQEHVFPLSGGGMYTRQNIIPACISCNSSKCNKDMEGWYRSQEYFRPIRLKKILLWTQFIKGKQQLALF